MTTIGDVLLIFGGILAVAFATWATMVLSTLLFPVRSAVMAQRLETSIGKTIGVGASVAIPALALILVLASLPDPLSKITALVLFFLFLGIAALGSGGVVRYASDRVRQTSGDVSVYGSTTRAGILLVGAINVPFFGWMFVAPLVLLASLGCFVAGFVGGRPTPAPWVQGADAP